MTEITHTSMSGRIGVRIDGTLVGSWTRVDDEDDEIVFRWGAEREHSTEFESEETLDIWLVANLDRFRYAFDDPEDWAPSPSQHAPQSLANQPGMTPGPWAIHEEAWPDGKVGWHVASTHQGHTCVATFHSEADARVVALVRNSLAGIESGLVMLASRAAHDPFRVALTRLMEQVPTPETVAAAERAVAEAEAEQVSER